MSIIPQPAGEATVIAETGSSPTAVYEKRLARFTDLRDAYNARRYRAANLTVALFFATVLCLGIAFFASAPLFVVVAVLAFAGFVGAFAWQAQLDGVYRRYDTLRTLCLEGLARLRRDWAALPLPPDVPTAQVAEHAEYAGDLDLLGRASLQQLLGGAATPSGQIAVREWLLAPAAPAMIRERQAAAAELAPRIDFRQELALGGRQLHITPVALERFLAWATGAPWLARRPWLLWLARLSPLLLIALLVAQFSGLVRYPFWLLFLGLNLIVTALYVREVEGILDAVAERQAVFRPYAALFRLVTTQSFAAPLLQRVQQRLAAAEAGGKSAEEWMLRLARIQQLVDLRLSMFSAVLQAVTLWSVHMLWLLERWQRVAGSHVGGWLATLSELDALAALATLAFENPTWAFPELIDPAQGQPAILQARRLGHPLLPPEVCVGNDVSVGPPGTFVFVTGSNMSGKSTLLRALGTNVVLAQMGAPVCAEALTLPPLALATSIRVQDSLEAGVSYFLAELQRLKDVLRIAREAAEAGERVPFFLLDEILHGTNTSERQVAARTILRHLLAAGGMGAVSTHDLSLADAPDLEARRTAVYFTEQFTRGPEGPSMRFDYILRPGIAPSTNALKLMEIVGLPVDELDV